MVKVLANTSPSPSQGPPRAFTAGGASAQLEGELAREAAQRGRIDPKMAAFQRRLPAHGMRKELLAAVSSNQVVMVSGETGCGKTAQVG